MITIQHEAPWQRGAREALLDGSLGLDRCSKSSEALRLGRLPLLALAAFQASAMVGSLRLWAITEASGANLLLLGPLAVVPEQRGQGLGARMVRAALNWAAVSHYDAVVLVGDEAYYRRFGFTGGLSERLFMAGRYDPQRLLGLELRPGALSDLQGSLRASGDFDPVMVDGPQVAALLAANPCADDSPIDRVRAQAGTSAHLRHEGVGT